MNDNVVVNDNRSTTERAYSKNKPEPVERTENNFRPMKQRKNFPDRRLASFRAKGVITEVNRISSQNDYWAAKVDIGGFEYEVPIYKNVKSGDVLELIVNVIKSI
jgi:hypothetical protein